jgi:TonB family protein
MILSLDSFGQLTKHIISDGIELNASTVDSSLNGIFCSMGEIPEFPGGIDRLISFAKKHIDYPKSAIKDSIEGKVVLQFTIDTIGKVIDESLLKSVRIDLDTVCLAMLRQMPLWKPGRIGDDLVSVRFIWTINFKLTKQEKRSDNKKARKHNSSYSELPDSKSQRLVFLINLWLYLERYGALNSGNSA